LAALRVRIDWAADDDWATFVDPRSELRFQPSFAVWFS
jgi:hypothetical protein